jgi:hypothetical protein
MQQRRAASPAAAVRRGGCVGAALALLTMTLSGCLSLKSNEASQTTPGKITLKAVVCASKYNRAAPDWLDCQPGAGGKDILFRDNTRQDATTPGFGQLLAGFRVPRGSVGPPTFATKDTSFQLSPSYTTELQRLFPASADQQWIGYISQVKEYNPTTAATRAGDLNVEFRLPPPVGGTPIATFRWREVVGFREGGNADAPVVCGDDPIGKYCVDSPPHSDLSNDLKTDVSDFGVAPGTGTTAYAGTTAVVPFTVRYSDGAGLGAKGYSLGASTEVPKTNATTDPATMNASPNSSTRATARVPIPADTPPGQYTVSLSAATGAPAVVRSNSARILVVPVPIRASGSPPSTNRALVDYRWTPTATGTRVDSLGVRRVPAGAKVAVACRGGGCAFRSKTIKQRSRAKLTALFRHRKLKPRAVVEIGITAPNYIGKVFTFTMRSKKRAPAGKFECLPPGAKKALPCEGAAARRKAQP